MQEKNLKKIRLLRIAFNDLGHGGIQSRIIAVTRQLKDYVDSDIVVFSSKEAYYDHEFLKYGRIIRLPHYEGSSKLRMRLDYYIRYFRIKKGIYKILIEYGPYDVVHSHSFFEAAPCLAAAKKAGIPIRIAHSHNTALRYSKVTFLKSLKELHRTIYRYIIRKNATHMIGCSQAAADYLFGKGYGFPIYNCVDLEKFNLNLYSIRKRSHLQLIHVGRYSVQKNQLFLLDVMKCIVEYLPDAKLTLIGHGDVYRDAVIKKIADLGLGDLVVMKPHDTDVAFEMANSDYFVFPSSYEGFGNVLLEAQAIGLRCFVSTEVTPEVDCGLLTFIDLAEGAQKWADIIVSYYKKVGTEKHPADMTRFSEEKFAQQFLSIYREVKTGDH